MGGLDVKILVGHLTRQIADIVDAGVQSRHHSQSGAGQFRCFILTGDLGNRSLQVSLRQQLHPLGADMHGHADVATTPNIPESVMDRLAMEYQSWII